MTKSSIEKIIIYSNCLNKEMSILVYLPYDYVENNNFLTLYYLHGRSGNENILLEAEINIVADRLIENQDIPSMIIVCPNIENSRGLNSSFSCTELKDPFERIINIGMYEDYLIKEVIPYIDKNFKTKKNRCGRFIGGVSAGGYAALHNILRHPELFTKAGGHMPAIELQLQTEDKPYFQNKENWWKYDPITIAKNHTLTPSICVYLDSGSEDEGEFYNGCSLLHNIFIDKGINSQNYIFKGHHNLEYIRSNMEKYLRFYGNYNDLNIESTINQ